jgi:hypothetical protein
LVPALVKSELNNTFSPMSEKMAVITDRVESLELDLANKIEDMEKKLKVLDEEQKSLKNNLHDLERKNKHKNLIIFGIQIPNNLTSHQEKEVAFKNKLSQIITDTSISEVKVSDIVSISFGNSPGRNVNNFAVITMASEHTKNSFYSQRTKLKSLDDKIYINEDLTKTDALLYKKARDDVKKKKLHSTWTKNGKVFAKLSETGKPFPIEA